MASRNSLVRKATEDLISGATPLKPSSYVFQPSGMRLSTTRRDFSKPENCERGEFGQGARLLSWRSASG